jgi:hypothetical protein
MIFPLNHKQIKSLHALQQNLIQTITKREARKERNQPVEKPVNL